MEEMQLHELKFIGKSFGSLEYTPLHVACYRGDASIFSFLSNKFGVCVSNGKINGLMHYCTQNSFGNSNEVIRGKIEIMESLLKTYPAFVEEKDPEMNRTPILMFGVHFRLIEFLIEKGADTRVLDIYGRSIVYLAAQSASPEDFHQLTELLLRKGLADVFFCMEVYGQSQLFAVLQSVEMKVETLELLAAQLKTHFKTWRNSNELFGAVMGLQRGPILKMLVEFGADPNYIDSERSNYLHLAAQRGNVEAIDFFCSVGLNVNARDFKNRTPLHVAITMGWTKLNEVVMALLGRGADATAVDDEGKPARNYAEDPGSIHKLNEATLQALQNSTPQAHHDALPPKVSNRKSFR